LPLEGDRKVFTDLVLAFLPSISDNSRLFPFTTQRGWQVVTSLVGIPCHWLRAYCEDYLYEHWGKDILAVSDYIKVDARTLQAYIRKRYLRYDKFV
jgi:hypothetical protein